MNLGITDAWGPHEIDVKIKLGGLMAQHVSVLAITHDAQRPEATGRPREGSEEHVVALIGLSRSDIDHVIWLGGIEREKRVRGRKFGADGEYGGCHIRVSGVHDIGLPLGSGQNQIEVAADLGRNPQARRVDRIVDDHALCAGFENSLGNAEPPHAENARRAVLPNGVQHRFRMEGRPHTRQRKAA